MPRRALQELSVSSLQKLSVQSSGARLTAPLSNSHGKRCGHNLCDAGQHIADRKSLQAAVQNCGQEQEIEGRKQRK
jgi:hypothetical protein